MQGPSKPKASPQELQLQQQGIARATSAEKITNAVQPHFLTTSKQDATQALKGRANADGSQQLNALVQGTSDISQKQNMQSAGINSLSGTSALARMQTGELNADLQRRVQKRADNLGALTAVATTGMSAYGNNNGIFADGKTNVDGSFSGRGILGGYGSGNNQAVDSLDKKLFDYKASQNT